MEKKSLQMKERKFSIDDHSHDIKENVWRSVIVSDVMSKFESEKFVILKLLIFLSFQLKLNEKVKIIADFLKTVNHFDNFHCLSEYK